MSAPPARPPRVKLHLGLRAKLILISLLLTFTPLLVVWSIGVYEELSRRAQVGQVREIADTLGREATVRRLSIAGLNRARGWLTEFASREHVMIRLIDARGEVVFSTRPIDAERWSNLQRGWFRRAGDFFFGPEGPPDLMAHEDTLPTPARRPEVRRALAGEPAERWRQARDSSLNVFYRALPLEGGRGALYLTRISRRSIRALYDLRYQLLKLTLYLALFAAVMGLWVGWRFVAPLVRLQRTIRAFLLSPTEIDPGRLRLERGDEIGDLSRDLQQLTDAMKRQLEQTAEIAADLAHDLKNPIATVCATSELLEGKSPLDPDRQRRLAQAMGAASEHMNRSVEGMLLLARLDQRLASTPRQEVDLSHLLKQLVESYRADPAAEGVDFHVAIAPGIRLTCLEEQLVQLTRNLIDNAIIFCRGRVEVSLLRDGVQLVLRVNDDGPGVSAGNQEKLFRRFFSARPDSAPQGTGLGLAIARAIAQAHGGHIASTNHGTLPGACFEVRLPASSG